MSRSTFIVPVFQANINHQPEINNGWSCSVPLPEVDASPDADVELRIGEDDPPPFPPREERVYDDSSIEEEEPSTPMTAEQKEQNDIQCMAKFSDPLFRLALARYPVEQTFHLLCSDGDGFELLYLYDKARCCLGSTSNELFDTREEHGPIDRAIRRSLNHSGQATGVFITMNPLDVTKTKRKGNPDSECVKQRRWLLVDLDPIRPAGESATAGEKTKRFFVHATSGNCW